MRLSMLLLALLLSVILGLAIEPAAAGNEIVEVRRPGDAFVVCNRRGCWWEPGTGYRFNRLFGVPRMVTAAFNGELAAPAPIGRYPSLIRRRR